MTREQTSKRKSDHIDLALQSQLKLADERFFYEPLLSAHPVNVDLSLNFLGKRMKAPIWASSMTGGAAHAGRINQNIARVCGKFGLGMGLGSCRIILDDDHHLADFQMRKYLGDDVPFFANLGIAQVERIVSEGQFDKIDNLIRKTETDGLIIHVNPLQEWLQPEGDLINLPAFETIEQLAGRVSYPIIVKEVGQGMGPKSLLKLMTLPIAAIDFGAFGGTNFSLLELLRGSSDKIEAYQQVANIGHDAHEMVDFCNAIFEQNPTWANREFIISGGVSNFLDGYYLINKLQAQSVYGHASVFLQHADKGFEALESFVENQINGLALANQYLTIR